MKPPNTSVPISDAELEALICDCLDLLLPTLPKEQAEVVHAIEVEGASRRTVADSLGLSLGEVTIFLTLGRQGLKDQFGEMRLICPLHGPAGCDCHLKGDRKT